MTWNIGMVRRGAVITFALTSMLLLLSACSTTQVRSTAIGAGLGAVAGCAVGSLYGACGHGAVIGGAAGGTIGAVMPRR